MTCLFKVLSRLSLAGVLIAGINMSTKAADFMHGAEVYGEYCASCHGSSGEGVAGTGELRSYKQLMKPDEELFNVIRDGQSAMPGYDGLLNGDEILDVIAYLRTFQ